MGTITLTLPVAGTNIAAGLHATNYANLQTLLNGLIDNANIAPAAAIAASKLAAYPADGAKVLKGDGTWGTAGAMTLIDDLVVAGSVLGNYDTNSRLGGNIPQTYKHLRLVISTNSNAGATDNSRMRFNGDVGANYYYNMMFSASAAPTFESSTGTSRFICGPNGDIPLSATNVAQYVIDFLNYSGISFRKAYTVVGNSFTTVPFAWQGGGLWASSAALTRIEFFLAAGNMNIGSRFSLYGIS